MVKNAIITIDNNSVAWIGESENPVLTPPPDYVVDITDHEGEVEIGMLYNAETNSFYWAEE